MKTSEVSEVSIVVDLRSIRGVKVVEKGESASLDFDVNAKLEERERKSGKVVVDFVMSVGTKPSVVKFEVEGLATLTGKDSMMEKMLEVDPETKIPFLLHKVYQRALMGIYLLASLIDSPYPPPDLLFSAKKTEPSLEVESEQKEKVEEEKEKIEEEKIEEEKKSIKKRRTKSPKSA